MSLSYVVISNTASIADGVRYPVKYETWRPSQPADESGIGLNGDTWQNVGAAPLKMVWNCTLFATRATLPQLATYAKSATAASRMTLFQDVDGVVWSAMWTGPFAPVMLSSGLNDPGEMFEVPMQVTQR